MESPLYRNLRGVKPAKLVQCKPKFVSILVHPIVVGVEEPATEHQTLEIQGKKPFDHSESGFD